MTFEELMAHRGKRCFGVLDNQDVFHGRLVSMRRVGGRWWAFICNKAGLVRQVQPNTVWSTIGWPER